METAKKQWGYEFLSNIYSSRKRKKLKKERKEKKERKKEKKKKKNKTWIK